MGDKALHKKASVRDCWVLPLQVYAESILALQHKAHEGGSSNPLPLVIMTSDDTHQRTQQLLDSHSFFGLSPGQVHLLKQEKVRGTLWALAGCTAGQCQLQHLQMLLAATELAAGGKACTLDDSCSSKLLLFYCIIKWGNR